MFSTERCRAWLIVSSSKLLQTLVSKHSERLVSDENNINVLLLELAKRPRAALAALAQLPTPIHRLDDFGGGNWTVRSYGSSEMT